MVAGASRGSVLLALAALMSSGCAAASEKAMMDAIDRGDRTALREALADKPRLDPQCAPYEICKPLARAASRADAEMVRMLIEAGADPNGRNAYDDTAFMLVGDFRSRSGQPEANIPVIRVYLLEHGTDPNQDNESGASAFMGVASLGDVPMLDLCLQHGGLINRQSKKIGYTPLMSAAQFGQAESVRWLLAHGADAGLRDVAGRTAKQIAEAEGHKAVVALLPIK